MPPPTPPPLPWTARPAGWDCPWPPVALDRLEDPPPPLGHSRDPLTRGLSWPPSFKEKSFTPSITLRKAMAEADRSDCSAERRSAVELRVKAEQTHMAWRNTRLRNLSACSERGLLLHLLHKRTHHLTRGTLPVPCVTRAERLAHARKLQDAAVARRLCDGLKEEWSDDDR